jgi:hypothetical protein
LLWWVGGDCVWLVMVDGHAMVVIAAVGAAMVVEIVSYCDARSAV